MIKTLLYLMCGLLAFLMLRVGKFRVLLLRLLLELFFELGDACALAIVLLLETDKLVTSQWQKVCSELL